MSGHSAFTAGRAVSVPAPAVVGDNERALVRALPGDEHPPAEGDSAITLALVHRAQAGDADAFGEL